METINFTEKLSGFIDMAIGYAPKLVLGAVVLVIGFWIANNVAAMIGKALDKTTLSLEIKPFLRSLVSVMLKVLVVFTAAGIIGIETTSFVAALAALGFAVGMALQGSLSHFAAGILILLFRPYKVGDYIQIGEHEGFVEEIQIITTNIRSLNNKKIIIPNGNALGDVIVNSEGDSPMRMEFNVSMPYNENFPRVKQIIFDALRGTEGVLMSPMPLIGIENFDSHSISVSVKAHCLIEKYESVFFDATMNVKQAMGANGVKVAYSEDMTLGEIAS